MPPRQRKNNTVEDISSGCGGIFKQPNTSFQSNCQSTNYWLKKRIEECKRQVIQGNSSPSFVPASVSASASSTTECEIPVAKKRKSEHTCDANEVPVMPRDVEKKIMSLTCKELRRDLKQRNLDTTGLKKILQERLLTALREEYAKERSERLKDEEEKVDSRATADESALLKDVVSACSIGHTPSYVNNETNALASHTIASDVGMTNLNTDELNGDEMDVEPTEANSRTAPVSTTEPNRISKEMDVDCETVKENAALQPELSEPLLQPIPTKLQDKPTAVDRAAVTDKTDHKTSRSPLNAVSENEEHNDSKLLESGSKRSRSPFKKVQSGVQNAIKMLTTKSPSKLTNKVAPSAEIAELKKMAELADKKQEPSNLANGGSFDPNKTKAVPMHVDATGEDGAPKESSSSEDNKKPVMRLLSTPAVGGTSAVKKGNSALKSKSVKAKNDARKAKIAEMRDKTKSSVTKNPFNGPKDYTGSLSKLKTNGPFSEDKDGKKRLLTAKMREKAAAAARGQITASSVAKTKAPVQTSALKKASSAQCTSKSSTIQASNVKKAAKVSALQSNFKKPVPAQCKAERPQAQSPLDKAERPQAQSPLDTYEISDREDSDEESEEESTSKPKKRIPSWAKRDNLIPALEHQYREGESKPDPDGIFGEVQTCNLQAIFDQKKKRYQKRTSSGNWTNDQATVAEKLAYKRTMGFSANK